MDDKIKFKIAFAEALVQTLWVKGLISDKEKELINRKNREMIMLDL